MPKELPDFNPAMLLGLGLSFMPASLMQRFLTRLTRQLNRLTPGLQKRLAEADGKIFHLMLADMPFDIRLTVESGALACSLSEKDMSATADVRISGASGSFIALLEGKSDGDALFFSRALQVEGDTEALLVLRNALDNESISLREVICSLAGPFSQPAAHIAGRGEKLALRFMRDMNWLYQGALAPLARRQAQMAERVGLLESRCRELERRNAVKQARKV